MFSNQSKNTIVHLIKDVVKGEKELENLKQSLILQITDNNVSYQTCFLHLAYEKDRITRNDLEIFLQSQQIRFDQREISMFKYTTYQDFLDLMLPNNQIFLKQYQQKQMNYNNPNSDILNIIGKVLGKNIEIIRKIQAYLDALILRFDKSTLLNYLCPKSDKNIPIFLQLLKNLDLDISFEDIICAMRRLDKDQDSDVNRFDWEEFFKCLKPPKSNQTSIGNLQKQINKQQSSKSINRSESRQKTDQENINSNRNVHFSTMKSSTKSLKKSSSIMEESILEFQLHLLTIGKLYEELDQIKLELSSRGDYSISQVFQFFDLDVDGSIGLQDLKLVFLQLGIDVNDFIIRQLIHNYSSHHSQTQWNLIDFKCLFPETKQNLNNYIGAFSYETKKIIKILIQKYLELIRYKKESTHQLGQDMKNIDIIFNFIDLDQDGIITQDDFKVLDIKGKHILLFFQQFQDYPYQITYNQFQKYFI
ncbi:unnamed protein product [Paramecium pentaurelia]|uniref:EF-hand domain-containing protein n=1 Tax=Paramecium pentaurelia TaxID=43138 RepID=A0A8S1XTN8_9CILI|nr:unnamed protein product [Paramecium pentaurelia]